MTEQTLEQQTRVLPTVAEYIVSSPGVRGGRPRIQGHRITVQDIVLWHQRRGMSPDEIASTYSLSLAEVYAALAYYHGHREEIDSRIQEDERFAAEMRARMPSLLKQRLAERHAADDPIPPG
jgi:uncharacterized protein (DUF433 family)